MHVLPATNAFDRDWHADPCWKMWSGTGLCVDTWQGLGSWHKCAGMLYGNGSHGVDSDGGIGTCCRWTRLRSLGPCPDPQPSVFVSVKSRISAAEAVTAAEAWVEGVDRRVDRMT
jgi:hypothetical protein